MEQKQPLAAAYRSGNGCGKANGSFSPPYRQYDGAYVHDLLCDLSVESGDRVELTVSGSDYGMLVEGDIGKLSFQGTRYLGFERN